MQVTCPNCKHSFDPTQKKGVRICADCNLPILKHHKWYILESMVRHRHCDNPDSYTPIQPLPDNQNKLF